VRFDYVWSSAKVQKHIGLWGRWCQGVCVKQIYIASYFRNGYSRFMQYINNISNHAKRESIEKRLEIIKFFDEFGVRATEKAFGKKRSTIYLWKQKIKRSGGKLSAIAPGDTTPLHKRKRIVHPFIENFIVTYRTNHPGSDKTTIAPALTAGCILAGIKPVSVSTVGRIIHDLKMHGRLHKYSKITINGRSGNLLVREQKQAKKKTRRKGFTPQQTELISSRNSGMLLHSQLPEFKLIMGVNLPNISIPAARTVI